MCRARRFVQTCRSVSATAAMAQAFPVGDCPSRLRKFVTRPYWNAPLPRVRLSPLQIFLLIGLLIALFWLSSRTKRFLRDRFLVRSGLDRALQHAIAQVVGYADLVIGIVIVLDNAGIHLGALTVFAGAVGVGVGFGLQNIASNFISGLVIL